GYAAPWWYARSRAVTDPPYRPWYAGSRADSVRTPNGVSNSSLTFVRTAGCRSGLRIGYWRDNASSWFGRIAGSAPVSLTTSKQQRASSFQNRRLNENRARLASV